MVVRDFTVIGKQDLLLNLVFDQALRKFFCPKLIIATCHRSAMAKKGGGESTAIENLLQTYIPFLFILQVRYGLSAGSLSGNK